MCGDDCLPFKLNGGSKILKIVNQFIANSIKLTSDSRLCFRRTCRLAIRNISSLLPTFFFFKNENTARIYYLTGKYMTTHTHTRNKTKQKNKKQKGQWIYTQCKFRKFNPFDVQMIIRRRKVGTHAPKLNNYCSLINYCSLARCYFLLFVLIAWCFTVLCVSVKFSFHEVKSGRNIFQGWKRLDPVNKHFPAFVRTEIAGFSFLSSWHLLIKY